jgi:hypothetical protein
MVVRSGRFRWAGNVTRKVQIRNAYRILVKRCLAGHGRRREDNLRRYSVSVEGQWN